MNFNSQLLFLFSAIGALNGLLMGFYFLFFAKPKHISNRFLGALLVILSVRIGKSVFFYFNPDLASIYLQIGLSACLFIGPFLYFYLDSVFNPNSKIRQYWKYHIVLLLPIIVSIGFKFPFKTHASLWREYIIMSIYLVWFIYTLASGYTVRGLFRKLSKTKEKLQNIEIWALSVFFGNVIILTAFYSFRYTYYIVGALSFTFIIYLLILLLVFNKKKSSILYKSVKLKGYKQISQQNAKRLICFLDSKMKSDKLYKNPNLKLPDLAKALQIPVYQLSQLLNESIGKSFYQYINEFRVEEAKDLILRKDSLTLEAIGYDCGFNSKSTFYTAFKKHTGLTPYSFKKKNSPNP